MKHRYYYLVASLPSLYLEVPPPVRRDEFLAMCKRYVKKNDFALLESINMLDLKQKDISSGVLGDFFNFESRLRNALAELRSQRLGFAVENCAGNDISDHEQMLIAEEALHAPSPLKAEEILNKARWRYLDELEFGHYFDRDRLVVFFIKLQILERIALFDAERGLRTLQSILDLDPVKAHYFNA
ncbi:MAG: DUF2764 domain-containing protein [Candidatus Scalindua sp.]|nr:DUF2764 domain-containing protein [Candidatus Scalindua sp.]